MTQIIFLVILLIIVVLVIVISMQSSDFRYTRSISIAAPASKVFLHVNNFHNWQAWSPWAKLDPEAKNTFEGPTEGSGAKFSWVGNNQIGEGRMTIFESYPYDLIRIKLEFLKPFTATNTAEFTFKVENNQTVVSWSMFGKMNFMRKAMGLMINCDKMIGGQFEKGLANLKSVVEIP